MYEVIKNWWSQPSVKVCWCVFHYNDVCCFVCVCVRARVCVLKSSYLFWLNGAHCIRLYVHFVTILLIYFLIAQFLLKKWPVKNIYKTVNCSSFFVTYGHKYFVLEKKHHTYICVYVCSVVCEVIVCIKSNLDTLNRELYRASELLMLLCSTVV
jgi:hypothetical protein